MSTLTATMVPPIQQPSFTHPNSNGDSAPAASQAALARKRRREKLQAQRKTSASTVNDGVPSLGTAGIAAAVAVADSLNASVDQVTKTMDPINPQVLDEDTSCSPPDQKKPRVDSELKAAPVVPVAAVTAPVAPPANPLLANASSTSADAVNPSSETIPNRGRGTLQVKGKKIKTSSNSRLSVRYEPTVPMTKDEASAWRKEARRVRNRESAAASRQKTRNRITELEAELSKWKSMYAEAEGKLRQLQQEQGNIGIQEGNVSTATQQEFPSLPSLPPMQQTKKLSNEGIKACSVLKDTAGVAQEEHQERMPSGENVNVAVLADQQQQQQQQEKPQQHLNESNTRPAGSSKSQ